METKLKITIPKPCHEDWTTMTPDETGRFCSVCSKCVIDFTDKSSSEIQEYFTLNQGKRVCGIFKNEQLNKFDIQIPQSVFKQKMPFHKAFLLALFIVMGTTLFSCKNDEGFPLGEVAVVEDTITEQRATIGIILPEKDTTKIDTDENFVYQTSEIDVLPTFKNDTNSFQHYFLSNFKIPVKYKSSDLSITISFIIERDGTLSNIKVLRNPFKELDADLIKIIKASPKWKPGEINGVKVRSYYIFPFHIAQSVD